MSGPRDCTCIHHCPDYAHCICLYDYKLGVCRVRCHDEAKVKLLDIGDDSEKTGGEQPWRKAALDSHVKLEMRGTSLEVAARLLAEVANAEIYVPAHRLDERRELYLEEVSLDTVVRELGLMAVVRP